MLIVTGYASLDKVVDFLALRSQRPGTQDLRIIFGNEPFKPRSSWEAISVKPLADEIRDYWLERGISVLLSAAVLRVRELVIQGLLQVRTGRRRRRLHAKIYVAADTVVLGSSNFTEPGLRTQSEANVRFDTTERARLEEARSLAEGLWNAGEDYSDGFLKLLDALLRAVTWQEALARACASVLDGDWARSYLPAEDLGRLERDLWPHQSQGIRQALWILENVGSVLVADAAGSGKTRMGSWIIRGAYDRQYRLGHVRRVAPVILAPPAVIGRWQDELRNAGIPFEVSSQGALSSVTATRHSSMVKSIFETELLAVDEAHRFLNQQSDRTQRLLAHYAEHAILFTATPINRGQDDLLAMIELIGADNLSDDALEVFVRLRRKLWRGQRRQADPELRRVQKEIERFMVRRTRHQLNRIAERGGERYRLASGRLARYPCYVASYYPCDATDADLEIARQIDTLTGGLTGVVRIGKKLELTQRMASYGFTEKQYVSRVVRNAPRLSSHFIFDCLRSSRAALFEHVYGTDPALAHFRLEGVLERKAPTGNVIQTLSTIAGRVPEWRLRSVDRSRVPPWLYDPGEHRRACEQERKIYEEIGALVTRLSDERERCKVRHLEEIVGRKGVVLAFDSHLISLALFRELLSARTSCELFTGVGGAGAKRRAEQIARVDTDSEPRVMLCSDALSEGLNLQGASCVVHLDTPTVIRTAEQRAGRVDRMDSQHDTVEIWWPKDQPGFAPRRRDLLRERNELVTALIGTNLELPDDVDDDDVELDIRELAETVSPDRPEGQAPEVLNDAFREVHALIGDRGLVAESLYKQMSNSQADIIACVSIVRSAVPWAFTAVGGLRRVAPRWVFFTDPAANPVTDLAEVARHLRDRLGGDPPSIMTRDEVAKSWINRFVRQLQDSERLLLAPRRRRAIELAIDVLKQYRERAWEVSNLAEHEEWRNLLAIVEADPHQPHADLGAIAEAWLRLVRPRLEAALRNRLKRRKLWTLRELEGPLLERPLPAQELRRVFGELPWAPPLGQRVVAMIVGVPE